MIPIPVAPLIGAGASLLGGLFGKGGSGTKESGTQNTSFNSTSTGRLGALPPELQGLDIQQLLLSGQLANLLGQERMNLPSALSLDALSSPIDFSFIDPAVKAAYDEAFQQSYGLAEESFGNTLDYTEGEANRIAEMGIRDIRGQAGQLGLRGSSRTAGQIGNFLGGINSNLMRTIQMGQENLAGVGVAGAGARAAGLVGAIGQSGQLGIQQRQLQMGLRGQADNNLSLLLANPLLANLFQRQAFEGTTTQSGNQTGTRFASAKSTGPGIGGALGGIGGALLSPDYLDSLGSWSFGGEGEGENA